MKKIVKITTFILYIILSNLTVGQRVFEIIGKGKLVNAAIFLILWSIAVIGLGVIFFTKNKILRWSLGSIVIVSAFLGMTYLNIGHHFLNFEDVELLWTARALATKAISFYKSFMLFPAAVAVVGIISLVINWTPKYLAKVHTALLSIIAIFPLLSQMAVSYKTGGFGTKSMPQQYVTISIFTLFQGYNLLTPGILGKRTPVNIKITSPQLAPKKLIFVVDESIRADYFDVRQKKKYLSYTHAHQERFINFGYAASGNNCSAYSNAILRMGGIKNHLQSIGHNPFIWNYAKVAGYVTYYIDGQLKHGELQNYLSGEELKFIDHFIQFDDVPEEMMDHAIAKKLKSILNSEERSFVYINKRGAHFPYIESYPNKTALYTPQMKEGEKIGESRQRLINSYKNAIYWSTDQFFKLLLSDQKLDDSVIFYTSDHGQNLMDHGVMTHCNTVDPVPYEGFVPLYVLTDIPTKALFYQQSAKRGFNHLTHFSIFPSLLMEMGFDKKSVIMKYGDGVDGPQYRKQEFTAGGLLPRFGRAVQWFSIKAP